MKKIMLTSLSAIMLMAGANAATPYAALKFGYNHFESETDPDQGSKNKNRAVEGFLGGVAGGASFEVSDMVAIRAELEYDYSRAKGRLNRGEDKTTVLDHKVLASGFVDFGGGKWSGFTPYVGLSAGYAFGALDSDSDIDINGFGLGAAIGVSYAISGNFSADLGFRWLSMSREYDEKFAGKGDFDTDESSLILGARYAF